MVQGKYFEELEIDDTFTSPGRTVTETDVMLFAGLSGDYNELHTSIEFAKETPFGQRIAHGLLGLSIASGLGSRAGFIEGTAIAFTGLEWKFKAPILIGDTIYLSAQVKKKRAMKALGGGMVILDIRLINQDEKTVQQGTWKVVIKSKPKEE
jgi:acyl dehydratase